jgi:hypothetical protein
MELERELEAANRMIAAANTGMRNAKTALLDGDEEEALEYLNQFVSEGDEVPNGSGEPTTEAAKPL